MRKDRGNASVGAVGAPSGMWRKRQLDPAPVCPGAGDRPKSNEGRHRCRPPLRPNPNPAPVRAWARPGRGSGRGLSASVGSLGSFRRALRLSSGSLTRSSFQHRCSFDPRTGFTSPPKLRRDPFASLGPKASGSQDIEESGVGFRLALLLLSARSNASSASILADVRFVCGGRRRVCPSVSGRSFRDREIGD